MKRNKFGRSKGSAVCHAPGVAQRPACQRHCLDGNDWNSPPRTPSGSGVCARPDPSGVNRAFPGDDQAVLPAANTRAWHVLAHRCEPATSGVGHLSTPSLRTRSCGSARPRQGFARSARRCAALTRPSRSLGAWQLSERRHLALRCSSRAEIRFAPRRCHLWRDALCSVPFTLVARRRGPQWPAGRDSRGSVAAL
jgi:hypothetical protein